MQRGYSYSGEEIVRHMLHAFFNGISGAGAGAYLAAATSATVSAHAPAPAPVSEAKSTLLKKP